MNGDLARDGDAMGALALLELETAVAVVARPCASSLIQNDFLTGARFSWGWVRHDGSLVPDNTRMCCADEI